MFGKKMSAYRNINPDSAAGVSGSNGGATNPMEGTSLVKLKSFVGSVTAMRVMPMNNVYLLGSDTGKVSVYR